MNTVLSHSAERVDINRGQVLRYLGYGRTAPDAPTAALLEECLKEFAAYADYRACSVRLPVAVTGTNVSMGGLTVTSASLAKNLAGCGEVILFAATIGAEADLRRSSAAVRSAAKAVVLDAIGTAAVEAWCNKLCENWQSQVAPLQLRPRFSPGYGDVPLELQRSLLSLLDSSRRAGISLTGALLMTPHKSVSAIVGVGERGCQTLLHDCAACTKTDCAFRLTD